MTDTADGPAGPPAAPVPVRARLWAEDEGGLGIRHGFFTRRGGVSTGPFASLNVGLGSGDDPDHVAENRRRACAVLGARGLYTPYQVHGTAVVEVTDRTMERVRADAVITRRPGLAVGVVTADCAPVLIAAARAGIVGAIHAGWRGAVAGIIESTLAAFARLGASVGELAAVVGPAIAQASYEVGEEVRTAACAAWPRAASFFRATARADRWLFDLPGFVAARLRRAGVETVAVLALDTYRDEARFFSYRRSTHRGETAYGRQLSAILLRPEDG